MRVSPFRTVLALGLVLVVLASGIGVNAQGPSVLYTTRQMGASDVPTLDPSVAQDVPSVQVIVELFPELNRTNEETAEVQDGMATLTVSDDGSVYTYSIMPEVPWVRYNAVSGAVEQVLDEAGNPRYVTANDYITGIIRTLDPAVASNYAGILSPWIVGGDAFRTSDPAASAEERAALIEGLGVRALDDYTLEITLAIPSVVFTNIAAMWIATAQPGWLIDEVGDFWIEPDSIETYGPYALKSWVHDESLTLIKNPFWPGTDTIPQASIDEIVFRFLDAGPSLAAYEAGEIQVSEIPGDQLDRILASPELSAERYVTFGTCSYYYGFNKDLEIFQDARVVRAFSMAIDRQAIIDNILRAGQEPAGFFTLPSMNAAPRQEDYPEYAIFSDPEAAAALFQEYLDEKGMTADQVTGVSILYNTNATHEAIAQAIQQMWAETLGVEVQLTSQDFGTYLEDRRNAPVWRAGWCFDYPDTNNWLYDVFHSSVDPDNHFNNPEFDRLVEQARVESDLQARTDLYAQAENILVNTDAAIAPIYYYVTQDMTKPNVERTHSVITREYYEKWSFVE